MAAAIRKGGSMPGPGGPGGRFGRSYLTEEEKASAPKVTPELLKRVFSYLKPYWKQMLLVIAGHLCHICVIRFLSDAVCANRPNHR